MTHEPACDWCGEHIAAGASMWECIGNRRIGARSESPRWIACSKEHLGLVLARDRWGQPEETTNDA